MAQSRYKKATPKFTPIGDVVITGLNNSATVANLQKEHHASEFVLEVAVSQPATVIPTGVAIDESFKRILLELNGKDRIAGSARTINVLNKLTEAAVAPRIVLAGGVATAYFTLELHIEGEGMVDDFIGLVNQPKTMSINLTTGDNSVFVGGTLSGTPTYTIKVRAVDYGIENEYEGSGVFMYNTREKVAELSTAIATPRTIALDGMCATRHIALIAGTVVGTVFTPSDDVITDITYTIGGKTTQTTWYALKSMMARKTGGYSQAGVSGIMFGDTLDELAESVGDLLITYQQANPAGGNVSLRVGHAALRSAV